MRVLQKGTQVWEILYHVTAKTNIAKKETLLLA